MTMQLISQYHTCANCEGVLKILRLWSGYKLYLAYLFSNADLFEIISKIPVSISGVKLLQCRLT